MEEQQLVVVDVVDVIHHQNQNNSPRPPENNKDVHLFQQPTLPTINPQDLEESQNNENINPGDQDQWMNAMDFASVQSSNEWDMLLTRGCGLPSKVDLTRDSLFVSFDPLVQKREAVRMNINPISELVEELDESGRISDTNSIIQIDEHEGNKLKEALAQFNDDIRMEIVAAKEDLNEMESVLIKESFKSPLLSGNAISPLPPTPKNNEESGEVYQKNFEQNQKLITTHTSQLETSLDLKDKKYEYIETSPRPPENNKDVHLFQQPTLPTTNPQDLEESQNNENINPGDQDQWMNAMDFASVQSSNEWDMLLTRGRGLPSKIDLTRDSLFVNFDPLVQKREAVINPISELDESGRISDTNSIIQIDEHEENKLKEALAQSNKDDIRTEIVIGSPVAVVEKPKDPEEDKLRLAKQEEEEKLLLAAKQKDALQEKQRLREALAQSNKEKDDIRTEIVTANEDLNEMESAFAEVLLLYESGKVYQKNFEQNQKLITTHTSQLEKSLALKDKKYEYIETKTQEMLERMKNDQEARLKILNNENYKLKASLKMSELKVQKMENEIEHFVSSNSNLQKLCDEMIHQC